MTSRPGNPTLEYLWETAARTMATFRLYAEEFQTSTPDTEATAKDRWRVGQVGHPEEHTQ